MKALKLSGIAAGMLLAGYAGAQTFTGTDVGTPTHAGSVVVNTDGSLYLSGGGNDIWNNSDNFFYYYTAVSGQYWDAVMRVVKMDGPDNWSKTELMIRRPATPGGAPAGGDPHFSNMVTRTNGQNEIQAQYRGTRDGASGNLGIGHAPNYPQWLRVRRNGSALTLYYGPDGVNWTQYDRQDTATTANGFDGTAWEDPILVGIAVTAHNDGSTQLGTALVDNLSIKTPTPPTAAGVVDQVQNASGYVGGEATFHFTATNNANPSDFFPMRYHWYKNNVAVSPNPMGPNYTPLVTAADNGAQVYCVADLAAPYSSVSVTSATVTLTVSSATANYTNGLKREFFSNSKFYNGASRTDVEAGSMARGVISVVSGAQLPGGSGNNYVDRFSGWFIPPATASYVFFVAADDDTDLFLSPADSDPTHKQLIAQEPGWSPNLSWLASGSGGTSDITQKRSDQWSPDPAGGVPAPNPNGFPLTAGHLYYLEAVHHQGGGGDNFAVTYQTTTQIQDPNWANVFSNGTPSLLQASNNNIALISGPVASTLTWTVQPTNTSVFEGQSASFYAQATSDSEFVLNYQWYRNGTLISGANGATYTIPLTSTGDNGAQFTVVAQTQEGGLSITSSPAATLSVQQSVWEPGFAKDEFWQGANRAGVENGTVGTPAYVTTVPAFEASINNESGDNYARRLSGYFVPPTTGLYDFYINSDDDSDLFLSTDNTPGNKRLIAQEQGWSNPFQWVSANGGSATMKCSATWSPDGVATPYAAGISLVGGQKYYIEAVHAEGGGGDNVEATYAPHGTAPVAGADTLMKGAAIGINAVRCTYMNFIQQPANVSAPPFGYASFTAKGSTDSTTPVGSTSGLEQTNNFVFYQWQKNGVDIPGANNSVYSFGPVLPADAGTQFSVRIRALGYADTALNRLWSNSLSATLTVAPQAVFETGVIQHEFWGNGNNQGRTAIESGSAGPATLIYALPAFEDQTDSGGGPPTWADNYGNRLSGFFIPPATDDYVFFLDSDDDADLFVSTDSNPNNKHLVAQEGGWSGGALNWSGTGGGGDTTAQRRSDQFTDPATGTQPYINGIHMLAGQKYYIEAVHHEGGGGDYVAVTFKSYTAGDPVNGEDTALKGNVIGYYVPRSTYVNFTLQPQSKTVTAPSAVTFTATAVSDGVAVGNVNPTINNGTVIAPTQNVTYQWYRNGNPIAGATTTIYTLPLAMPSDSGAQFVCASRGLGLADNALNPIWSNSQPATLTVIADTVAPTIAYAGYVVDTNLPAGQMRVDITFNELMDVSTLGNMANYSVSGGSIASVNVNTNNNRSVELVLNGALTLPATVTVSGVKDYSGNTIAANSTMAVGTSPLTCSDIGATGDPAYPTLLWALGANAYMVSAEGSDIWGTADGFNFLWEQKSGDFDVVVRQKSITHTSQWAKGGLMVRETLDAGSRNWNIVNDPLASDGINAPDGSGFGANVVECNTRNATGQASGGWANGTTVNPAYPNAWVRLKRAGGTLTAYASSDGVGWTLLATQNPASVGDLTPLPNTVYVGICTTAHNNDGATVPPFLYYNTSEYADYNSSFIAAAPRQTLTVSRQGGNLSISWSPAGGHLESSPAVSGAGVNWQTVGTANPATVAIGSGTMYFRVSTP